MFKVGDKILIKKTNQKGKILNKFLNIYLIQINNDTDIRFEHEIEKYNLIKKKWRDIKHG